MTSEMEESKRRGTEPRRPRVVIIGGGFGGLSAALELSKLPVNVTLIDRTNHHLFQPLLYQVATSGLGATDIAKPLRSILRNHLNVETVMDEVVKIDPANRMVIGQDLDYPYDYLILAAGARHSYFGNDAWEEFAPGLKTLDDALEIRRKILTAFERAEKTHDPARCRAQMTFVVVGGGPTGVEMAGAIAELAHVSLKRDFRRINPKQTRIILAEGGPRVLASFPEKLSDRARNDLEKLGVEVHLNQRVTDIGAHGVRIGDQHIEAATVVWAAGNLASPLGKQIGAETDREGRVVVQPDLSVKAHPEIFVIGDTAAMRMEDGSLVPGVAQGAMQSGAHAAKEIGARLEGKQITPFRYFDKGNLATIGRNSAVADMHFIQVGGIVAFGIWAFIHLFFLVGFRNRAVVFIQWTLMYFFFTKGARIISREDPHPHPWKAERNESGKSKPSP